MTAVRRTCSLLALALAGAAVGVLVPSPAQAVTDCPSGQSTSWTNTAGGPWSTPGNWSNGVPGGGCDASITANGNYTVTITDFQGAKSLVLGGSTGTQTVQVKGTTDGGGNPVQAKIEVGGDQTLTVGSHGVIQLTATGANPNFAILAGGQLVNHGLVRTDVDPAAPAVAMDIRTNVTNAVDGTMQFNANTNSCACGSGGVWVNDGTVTTASGTSSDLSRTGAGVSFTQSSASGHIVNDGELVIDGTFTNSAGSTSGANPVEVCGNLDASGPASAHFAFAHNTVCNHWGLSNDVGPATSVLARNATPTDQIIVGTTQPITNRGTLVLDGVAGSPQAQLIGSPVTNEGSISFLQPGQSLLTTPLVNHGTVTVGPGDDVIVRGPITQSAGLLHTAASGQLTTNQNITLAGGTISNEGTITEAGAFRHTGGATTGLPVTICGGELDPTGPGTASFVIPQDASNTCGNGDINSDIGSGDSVEIQANGIVHDTFFNSGINNHGTVRLSATGAGYNQLHPSGGSVWNNEGSFTVASGYLNNAMNMVNSGALTVSPGTSMNGGSYVQQAGTMAVNGTLNGAVTVTGGTLEGSGTIASTDGVTNVSGTVHPGQSPGVLHLTGPYAQAGGGTLAIDATGPAAGTGFSQLVVSGPATLAGKLAVTSPTAQPGTLRVLTAASVKGTFASATFSGPAYGVSYDATGVTLSGKAQKLSHVKLSPSSLTAGKSAKLKLTLASAATVSFVVSKKATGHVSHGTCSVKASKGRSCRTSVVVAHSTHRSKAGATSFSVPVSKLKPGRYTVTVSVPGPNGKPVKASFTLVVKARRSV